MQVFKKIQENIFCTKTPLYLHFTIDCTYLYDWVEDKYREVWILRYMEEYILHPTPQYQHFITDWTYLHNLGWNGYVGGMDIVVEKIYFSPSTSISTSYYSWSLTEHILCWHIENTSRIPILTPYLTIIGLWLKICYVHSLRIYLASLIPILAPYHSCFWIEHILCWHISLP